MTRAAQGAPGLVLPRVLAFSLGLALIFTLVANTLPQVEGEAPVDEALDVGGMDMAAFVALGEAVFVGKGTCALCHNDLGRAPDLLALDAVAASNERLADPAYRGKARDAAGYLRESMVDPDAYVVSGYGKKGTGDTESPMPAVDRAPIGLGPVEIDAVIAYLQHKDGHEVTVSLPAAADEPAAQAASEPAAPAQAAAAPARTPEEALAKYFCAACHTVLGTESPVGPPLSDVGARLDRDAIRESIVAPGAVIAEGYAPGIMPADLADKMTAGELEMLVAWLAEQR